jgi:hypothetical protein
MATKWGIWMLTGIAMQPASTGTFAPMTMSIASPRRVLPAPSPIHRAVVRCPSHGQANFRLWYSTPGGSRTAVVPFGRGWAAVACRLPIVDYQGSFPVIALFPELELSQMKQIIALQNNLGQVPHNYAGNFDRVPGLDFRRSRSMETSSWSPLPLATELPCASRSLPVRSLVTATAYLPGSP